MSIPKKLFESPFVAAILIALGVLVFVGVVFTFLAEPRLPARQIDTVLKLAGGAIVLIGSYLTARTVKASRVDQLANRFIRAAELLATSDRETRLAGLYVLRELAAERDIDSASIKRVLDAFCARHQQDPERNDECKLARGISSAIT
ncbi:MAG: hypothetical protein LC808_21965 [Actinobacteria bacterium]|nr:hypothetical protein [Actinomycetota bacterium]